MFYFKGNTTCPSKRIYITINLRRNFSTSYIRMAYILDCLEGEKRLADVSQLYDATMYVFFRSNFWDQKICTVWSYYIFLHEMRRKINENLTSKSAILLEEIVFAFIVTKFSMHYATRRFSTVFTIACRWSLSLSYITARNFQGLLDHTEFPSAMISLCQLSVTACSIHSLLPCI